MVNLVIESELNNLVQEFENCTLTPEFWHHKEHVMVAYYYLKNYSKEIAIEKISSGIQKLNAKNNIAQTIDSGYHHTWTVFFSLLLLKHMQDPEFNGLNTRIQIKNACEFLSNFKNWSRQYYSKDLIFSWKARLEWVEPDLKQRDF